MHFFHPTPLDIVEQFISAKTKGKYFENVLDPCVGDGALLTSLEKNFGKITIIDIDSEKLNKFQNSSFVKYGGDFLSLNLGEKFDLILCNPPFYNRSVKGLSIEEKFLSKCLAHLKNEAYGIFILPSSIINGTKAIKIREYLTKKFTILSIDILPKKSFTKIESHFYIITLKNTLPSENYIFDTNMGQLNIQEILVNDHLTLNPKILFSSKKYREFLDIFPSFNLSNESLFRGNTQKNQSQLHTTHFSSHIYNPENISPCLKNGKKIKRFDLMFKRVGRNCHDSFSIYCGNESLVISDCITIIPSHSDNYLNNLIRLLNIRLSILFGASSNFMIDGSGANYIPLEKIKKTEFINFENYFSEDVIKKYNILLLKKDINSLLTFEKELKNKIIENLDIK
ncbi:hypothetical protein F971_00144 [Acinetobacter vivianii]|uniref:site-specific DNA-methyltransferase (adenine-specific) n=1 Tax=Acinetobacter vivianii TaxID=1776742 RepID=N8WG78_9GAMM|nr:methyltransferase [Acinetobacter vivianii]ENU94247.1 hypothetical protein F971_00144 [Acinetobacter vivianii]